MEPLERVSILPVFAHSVFEPNGTAHLPASPARPLCLAKPDWRPGLGVTPGSAPVAFSPASGSGRKPESRGPFSFSYPRFENIHRHEHPTRALGTRNAKARKGQTGKGLETLNSAGAGFRVLL
jgi:hypothetical protein